MVCIRIQEILPNQHNKGALYQRTIYLKNNKPIADSDELDTNYTANDLVNLGYENLKIEYSTLN
ncbi:MAG: hypothetical protein JKY16_06550 [Lutibacter sp.]|nr:hypothetical protein [Lutibacter sp.]